VSAEVIIGSLFIFALAGFLGLELIRNVPRLLHTPLMALTNALSAIGIVAAIYVLGEAENNLQRAMCFVAITAFSINIVGGFIITDRMLKMFKPREKKPAPAEGANQ
jgi:NAD(P) transhydrogenase subunit alpha